MKNIIFLICISFFSSGSFAQYKEIKKVEPEEEPRGFKKDHLFTGGGIQLSLSNYDFGVGASPVLGYSFNRWFEAGIGVNFNYVANREAYVDQYGYEIATGNKIHLTDIAPIAFGRVYPVRFLFLQAQAEENIISAKYIYADGQPSDKVKYDVASLLVGAGFASGREGIGDFFYYISISIDVLKKRLSPYVQQVSNGSVYFLPILRAGIQIPLFQGGRGRED